MDLEHAGYPAFAWRLLNNYLTETGDYDALPLLRFYSVYRAMVRAKVTAIRYTQTTEQSTQDTILQEHFSYLQLAEHYTHKQKPLLILTYGVSGSGKTSLSHEIAQTIQAVHVRSDVERKRLSGLRALERTDKAAHASLYSEEKSRATYKRLLDVATLCIANGLRVIVDATFLTAESRRLFLEEGRKLHCKCRILHFHAPREVLIERVQKRYLMGNDASEADIAVLMLQLEKQESLTVEEEKITIRINTAEAIDVGDVVNKVMS